MPRGKPSPIGTERVSQNGYTYTRTSKGWVLKHWLVAETILGRPLDTEKEMARFKDGDKTNFDPNNIEVVPKERRSTRARIATLQARIDELIAQKALLEEALARE